MRTIAAYLLTASCDLVDAGRRIEEIDSKIDLWLQKKGVSDPRVSGGAFESLSDAGGGRFERNYVNIDNGYLEDISLTEMASTGQFFRTIIKIIKNNGVLHVFCSLSVDGMSGIISPINLHPKCPKIIRDIIGMYDDWTFGGRVVPSGSIFEAVGEERALELCNVVQEQKRNFPIIVISIDADEIVWPSLAKEMARDLVGIAYVAVIDEIGSWTMTGVLGKADSCYLGAIRLYWPPTETSKGEVCLRGTVWTSFQLSDRFGLDDAGMKRFLSFIRRTIMSTAALTISPPSIAREIENIARREWLRNLEASVRDKELDSIIEENSKLENENVSLKEKIAFLEWRVNDILDRNSEYENDHPAVLNFNKEQREPPKKGEVRFYKKVGNTGDGDIFVQTQSCSHNAWKPAFKADQAQKGLSKFEGRDDWQTMQHCGSCRGGGRWLVRW